MTQLPSFHNPKVMAPVYFMIEHRVGAVIKLSFKHIFTSDQYNLTEDFEDFYSSGHIIPFHVVFLISISISKFQVSN